MKKLRELWQRLTQEPEIVIDFFPGSDLVTVHGTRLPSYQLQRLPPGLHSVRLPGRIPVVVLDDPADIRSAAYVASDIQLDKFVIYCGQLYRVGFDHANCVLYMSAVEETK